MAEGQTAGTIVQCIGPVIAVEFTRDSMPHVFHALKLEAEDSDKLSRRERRIYHGAKHVEKCFYSEIFSDRCHILHCGMKKGRMHETDIGAVEAFLQGVNVVGKFITKELHHVGRTAGRRHAVITMLRYWLPCRGHNER